MQVERRAADDLEHIGGGGLLLQRLLQVAGAGLHFLEQPDIAECDHGLIGEGLQQRDLPVAEGVDFGAAQNDRADALAFAQSGTLRMVRSPCERANFRACGNLSPSGESRS